MEQSRAVELARTKSVTELSDEEWKVAMNRFRITEPILTNKPDFDVRAVTNATGISQATIYRWLEKFKNSNCISSLVNADHLQRKGKIEVAGKS
jgi:putative transposase